MGSFDLDAQVAKIDKYVAGNSHYIPDALRSFLHDHKDWKTVPATCETVSTMITNTVSPHVKRAKAISAYLMKVIQADSLPAAVEQAIELNPNWARDPMASAAVAELVPAS